MQQLWAEQDRSRQSPKELASPGEAAAQTSKFPTLVRAWAAPGTCSGWHGAQAATRALAEPSPRARKGIQAPAEVRLAGLAGKGESRPKGHISLAAHLLHVKVFMASTYLAYKKILHIRRMLEKSNMAVLCTFWETDVIDTIAGCLQREGRRRFAHEVCSHHGWASSPHIPLWGFLGSRQAVRQHIRTCWLLQDWPPLSYFSYSNRNSTGNFSSFSDQCDIKSQLYQVLSLQNSWQCISELKQELLHHFALGSWKLLNTDSKEKGKIF